jgi:hypothetical protein
MNRRFLFPFLAASLAAAVLAPRDAAACDSSSCVLATRSQGGLAKGKFSIDLSFRLSDESKRLAGGSNAETIVIPRIDFDGQRILPGFHQELDGAANSLQADIAYGISSRWTAQVSVPLFTRKAYAHAHLPATHTPPPTDPAEPAPEDPHGHGGPAAPVLEDREYRSDGYGDTLLGVRYAVWGGSTQRLDAGFALKLPTGESQVPNAYDGGLHDPMLQPGTGSLDYLLSAQYVRSRGGPVTWTVTASQLFPTANELDYRFGHETIVGVGFARTLRAVYSRSMVTASVQLKAHGRGHSTYLGQEVPSTGFRMVLLSPGLRVTTPGGLGFYAYLQLPVYRYVNDEQLTTRSSILTGISKGF